MSGQSYTWEIGSGVFAAATSWSPTGVPTAADTVTFNSGSGSVSGPGSALYADFAGGDWTLTGAFNFAGMAEAGALPLALTVADVLTLNSGTIAASLGTALVAGAAGPVFTVGASSAATFLGMLVGDGAGNTGSLVVSGAGAVLTIVSNASAEAAAGLAAGSSGNLVVGGVTVLNDQPGDTGQLTVAHGGSIAVANTLTVGGASASRGQAVIGGAGAGSVTAAYGDVDGVQAAVTLGALGGLTLGSASNAQVVGLAVGQTGQGQISIDDGLLTVYGIAAIGLAGTAAVTLQAGGVLRDFEDSGHGGVIIGRGLGTNTAQYGIGGTGDVTVQAGAAVSSQDGVFVGGRDGMGTLQVDGGLVTANVDVSGNDNGLSVGGTVVSNGTTYAGGYGVLNIDDGGEVQVVGPAGNTTNFTEIGGSGTGYANVSGAGALLNAGAFGLYIGANQGSLGTLTVSGGGTVETATSNNSQLSALSVGKIGDGLLTVTGPASALTADGAVYIGRAGSGQLIVSDGGVVSMTDPTTSVQIGVSGGSTIIASGGDGAGTIASGGSLQDQGRLLIGGGGTSGQLDIDDGVATVVGETELGLTQTYAAGTAFVSTTGTSVVSSATTLPANGALQVVDGGTLDAQGGLDIATGAGGGAEVIVYGGGQIDVTGGSLVVGDQGIGELTVATGGAVVTSGGGADVGAGAGASGSHIDVTGSGALFQDKNGLVVGDGAQASLTVTNGASASAASLVVGNQAGGTGQIDVSGALSTFTVTNAATVGGVGVATFVLSNDATGAVGGDLDVASDPASSGYVDVENGADLSVGGDLNVGVSGSGSATFVLGAAGTLTLDNGSINVGPAANFIQNGALDPTVNVSGTYKLSSAFNGVFNYVGDAGLVEATLPSSGTGGPTFGNDGTAVVFNTALNDALGTFKIDNKVSASGLIDVQPGVSLEFAGTGDLNLLTGSMFDGDVTMFGPGSTIEVQGAQTGTFAPNPTASAGGVFTVFGADDAVLQTVTFDPASGVKGLELVGDGIMECLLAGTRVATARGDVAAEDLRAGDLLAVAGGGFRPAVWVGRRRADAARHPRPSSVLPVRVRAGAFGPGLPARDLWLSPGHAVFMDGHLIPVRRLIDGAMIAQDATVARPLYVHVELDAHDAILAEGLPVESYLDVGDKSAFQGAPALRLHPDFASRAWEAEGFAPLAVAGPVVDRVRARVRANAAAATTVRRPARRTSARRA